MYVSVDYNGDHKQILSIDHDELDYFEPLKEMIECHLADWMANNPNLEIPKEKIDAEKFLNTLCDFIKEQWPWRQNERH